MQISRVPVSALAWLRDHGYLIMAAGCALVLVRAIDFSPPEKVRVDEQARSAFVGDAPVQEFNEALANPQAVQVRATLREYMQDDVDASTPNPEVDELARVLSQPVVTTIFGLTANIDQTVHLDGGSIRVDVSFEATPRLVGGKSKRSRAQVSMEHRVAVAVTRDPMFGAPERHVVVSGHGVLTDVSDAPYRMSFRVDDRLFALDVELNYAG